MLALKLGLHSLVQNVDLACGIAAASESWTGFYVVGLVSCVDMCVFVFSG